MTVLTRARLKESYWPRGLVALAVFQATLRWSIKSPRSPDFRFDFLEMFHSVQLLGRRFS